MSNPADLMCELCDQSHAATHRCVECEQPMCEAQRTLHARLKATHFHQVLPLGVAKVHESSCCPEHSKRLELWDKQCGRLLCVSCVVQHQGHAVQNIPEAARDCRRQIDALLRQSKAKLPALRLHHAQLLAQLEQLKDNQQQTMDKLKAEFIQIRAALEDRERALSTTFEGFVSLLTAKSEQVKRVLDNMATAEDRAKLALDLQADVPLLLLKTDVGTALELQPTTVSIARLEFKGEPELFTSIVKFGSVQKLTSHQMSETKSSLPGPPAPLLGQFVRMWGSKGTVPGRFEIPYGVAVSDDGEVFVSDYAQHRIQVFRLDGSLVRAWGSKGSGTSEFNCPTGVAVSKGEVYVSDRENGRIQVFTTAGRLIRELGSNGIEQGQLQAPQYIAISDCEVFVAEALNNRVQVFREDGKIVRMWGKPGTGPGEFSCPRGVAVARGEVFVADQGNHRIQVFQRDGTFVRMWGLNGKKAGQFQSPWGVAVSPLREIIVTDRENRVQVFRADGSLIRVFGSTNNGLRGPRGVAVSAAASFLS